MAINLLRSVPFIILLIAVLPFTRLLIGTTLGPKAVVVPLVIAAFPYIARMAESSFKEVDKGVLEAAKSMGANDFQIVCKVLLPEALPSLLSLARKEKRSQNAMKSIKKQKMEEKAMKKRSVIWAVVLGVGILAACGGKKHAESAAVEEGVKGVEKKALEVIKVGASPAPHAEILRAVREILFEKGYDLEMVEYTDYVQPNLALESGELDANYFQHTPYLVNFCEERGLHLENAGGVHYEPFCIYGGRSSDLTNVPEGAKIALPNDVTNEARALLLLADQGLITLKIR